MIGVSCTQKKSGAAVLLLVLAELLVVSTLCGHCGLKLMIRIKLLAIFPAAKLHLVVVERK